MGKLKWKGVSQGVYDIECVGMNVRLIVLSKIPKSANNELWRLFSARAEVVKEAISHYQESYRNSEYSVLMQQLYEFYLKEKLPMTYTLEQFKKDFVISHLREIPTEEVLKQYSPEEVLKQYSPKEVLKQYSLQEFLEGLSPETLEHLAIILSQLGVNQIKDQEQ
jgi:anaerobic ribonucleoside-triphosphate reductase